MFDLEAEQAAMRKRWAEYKKWKKDQKTNPTPEPEPEQDSAPVPPPSDRLPGPPDLISPVEAAKLLNIPKCRINSLIRRELIRHYRFSPRSIMLDKRDLQSNYAVAWERAKAHKGTRNDRHRHNCTRFEYEMRFIQQKGRCAICGAMPGKLFVDHCHKTSKTRGLLCAKCNLGLGAFRDSPRLLKAAAEYLKQNDFMKEFRAKVLAEVAEMDAAGQLPSD